MMLMFMLNPLNWLRLIGEKLGLWRCCWLEDFDGELTFHIARKDVLGRWSAARLMSTVVLHEDGHINGPSFVEKWFWHKDRKVIQCSWGRELCVHTRKGTQVGL